MKRWTENVENGLCFLLLSIDSSSFRSQNSNVGGLNRIWSLRPFFSNYRPNAERLISAYLHTSKGCYREIQKKVRVLNLTVLDEVDYIYVSLLIFPNWKQHFIRFYIHSTIRLISCFFNNFHWDLSEYEYKFQQTYLNIQPGFINSLQTSFSYPYSAIWIRNQ